MGIPELTTEQVEELCSIAEYAARKYVLSKVPQKKIEKMDIIAEANGTRPVTLTIDVDIALSPSIENLDVQKLVDKAVKEAFASAEKYLRKLKCHSLK
ncbi:MAG: DUF3194 domain-containing protein [Candidatus Bathyarchaeia archaeon]